MYLQGNTFVDIAKKFKFSPNGVKYQIINLPNYSELKVTHDSHLKSWDSNRLTELARLYKSGMQLKDIAAHFNVSISALKNRIKQLPNLEQLKIERDTVVPRSIVFNDKQSNFIISSYINGTSINSIAKEMDVAPKVINNFLTNHPNFEEYTQQHNSNQSYKIVWKPEDIQNIIKSYISGTDTTTISKSFNVNQKAISNLLKSQSNFEELKAQNLNNSKTKIKWSPQLINDIITDYKNGSTIQSISEKNNISMAVVHAKIKEQPNFDELKQEHNSHKFNYKELNSAVLALYTDGYPITHIAKQLNVSPTPVRKIILSQPNYEELARINSEKRNTK
jgi:DNA-binding NarL/FixJ family response regulator